MEQWSGVIDKQKRRDREIGELRKALDQILNEV